MPDAERELVMHDLSAMRFAPYGLPYSPSIDAVAVRAGDWDRAALGEELIGSPSVRAETATVPVAIGRDGTLIVEASALGAVRAAMQRSGCVRLTVALRHAAWNSFRDEILQVAHDEGGLLYAPLTHPDLRAIPSWNGEERFAVIRGSLSEGRKTVLDIGAHWGYMCEQFERLGHRCVGVEIDPESYSFMRRLRRAQKLTYTALLCDIVELAPVLAPFDVVLALAVFHHFIKTRAGYDRLVSLLQTLKMREMYFWASNPNEEQMRGAYVHFDGDEFAEFIVDHSCLRTIEPLAEIEYRRLYRLTA